MRVRATPDMLGPNKIHRVDVGMSGEEAQELLHDLLDTCNRQAFMGCRSHLLEKLHNLLHDAMEKPIG